MSVENCTQIISSFKINGVEVADRLKTIEARQESITTALSSSATDYNTEILDARADAFGNSKTSLGANVRDNQLYLYNLLLEKVNTLQSQYDNLSAAYISLSNTVNNLISKGE